MAGNFSQEIDAELLENLSRLKKNPNFDPKREKELDDLYNQYIPPHSIENRSHLLDAAERDAYIDPFPPIGSQKMAGVFVKKAIKKSIGWYIQYIAQQISTFGGAVSQSLRSINNDIEKIKKRTAVANDNKYHESLDLDSDYKMGFAEFLKVESKNCKGLLVISDGIPNESLSGLDSDIHPVIVESRIDYCAQYDPEIDTRIKDIIDFLETTEEATLDGAILHGRIVMGDESSRVNAIEAASKALKSNGKLMLVIPKNMDEDRNVYLQLSSANLWDISVWKHILNCNFAVVESDEASFTNAVVLTAYKSKSM